MGTWDVRDDAKRPRLSRFLELGPALSGKKKAGFFRDLSAGGPFFPKKNTEIY